MEDVESKLVWADVYSEAELYRAAILLYTKPLFRWRRALLASTDGKTFYDFARKGLRNLDAVHRRLSSRRFAFRPGVALHRNFNGRRRTLYLYPWEERLVDVLLYRVLNERLDGWFSGRSFAYRVNGFGVDRCQREIAGWVRGRRGPLYVVKRDIVDFFGSIDHELLLGELGRLVDTGDYLYRLLEERVRFRVAFSGTGTGSGSGTCRSRAGTGHGHGNEAARDGEEYCAERGVPFGTPIACLFANVYLTRLDRDLERCFGVRLFRYADDLLLMSSDRAAACEAAAVLGAGLRRLGLASKASHERNLVLGGDGDDMFESVPRMRHLGLEFRADGSIGLSRDKFRKIRNLFRFAFRRRAREIRRHGDPYDRALAAVDIARTTLERGVRNVAIVDYYLRHVTDEAQLRLLDRWLAEEVLSLAFRNGHRKGNFRRLSFQRLRAMGLPSLVHRRRLILRGKIETSFFMWQASQERRRSARRAMRGGGCQVDGHSLDHSAFSRSPEAAAETTS